MDGTYFSDPSLGIRRPCDLSVRPQKRAHSRARSFAAMFHPEAKPVLSNECVTPRSVQLNTFGAADGGHVHAVAMCRSAVDHYIDLLLLEHGNQLLEVVLGVPPDIQSAGHQRISFIDTKPC